MKSLFRSSTLIITLFASGFTGQAQTPVPAPAADGALAAIQDLPAKYQAGIMKVSAEEGNPNPAEWYVIAKSGAEGDELWSITMARGRVVQEKVSLDLRTIFGESAPINLLKVKLDSADAWAVAEKYYKSRRKKFATASYALQQQGREAVPVWSVWCYDIDGDYVGLITLMATTGEIITSE